MKQRRGPRRLAEKLKAIRLSLRLTQVEMISHLKAEEKLIQAHISAFERRKNNRLPSYDVLLRYARTVNVSTDILIDDELNLPDSVKICKQQ